MKRLNSYGLSLQSQFEATFGTGNCSCHTNPPCGSCTHPGNPVCLDETPEAWDDFPSNESFLIEISKEGQQANWLCVEADNLCWTTNAYDATWFRREDDAKKMLRAIFKDWPIEDRPILS